MERLFGLARPHAPPRRRSRLRRSPPAQRPCTRDLASSSPPSPPPAAAAAEPGAPPPRPSAAYPLDGLPQDVGARAAARRWAGAGSRSRRGGCPFFFFPSGRPRRPTCGAAVASVERLLLHGGCGERSSEAESGGGAARQEAAGGAGRGRGVSAEKSHGRAHNSSRACTTRGRKTGNPAAWAAGGGRRARRRRGGVRVKKEEEQQDDDRNQRGPPPTTT